MLLNGLGDASSADLERRIDAAIRGLPRVTAPSKSILKHLVRRSGLLLPVGPDRFGFVHRTFLEYLAAGQALDENNIPLLIGNADALSWRETIALAVGRGRKWEQESIIRGILKRCEAGDTDGRVRETATSCIETATHLAEDLHEELLSLLAEHVPPKGVNDIALIASAGNRRPTRACPHGCAAAGLYPRSTSAWSRSSGQEGRGGASRHRLPGRRRAAVRRSSAPTRCCDRSGGLSRRRRRASRHPGQGRADYRRHPCRWLWKTSVDS
jgi:hypothetical protein